MAKQTTLSSISEKRPNARSFAFNTAILDGWMDVMRKSSEMKLAANTDRIVTKRSLSIYTNDFLLCMKGSTNKNENENQNENENNNSEELTH